MDAVMIGFVPVAVLVASLLQPVHALAPGDRPPPETRRPIQGVLWTNAPPQQTPCLVWRIENASSGEMWEFWSDADLSPFVGQYVGTWLNWAIGIPCGTLDLVPYVSGVTLLSVESASWGQLKSQYRDGPSN